VTLDAETSNAATRELQPARLPPYSALDEPLLVFNAGHPEAKDVHPLRGLASFGPFSSASIPAYTPRIRVATIGPRRGQPSVRDLVGSLNQEYRANDSSGYVPTYPGFSQLFATHVALAENSSAHIAWPDDLAALSDSGSPQQRLASAIQTAISTLAAVRGEFDVALVHLPDAWGSVSRSQDFDAHDLVKAIGALNNVPTQVLNDRVFEFRYLAQRSWRLAIALYVKVGGIPWKLAPLPGVPPATAYVGLAYALRGDPREAHFVTCCSQVFDSDGGGMQFVAYDAKDPIEDSETARRNPYLSRSDMRAVLARSLRTYQSRNGGAMPRRVVIHKLTAFREEELEGVEEALSAVDEIECIEITTNVAWRAVWLQASRTQGQPSTPARYPVSRGTMLPVSGTAALLWAAGNSTGVSARGSFYQGGKSIPRPILLTRHIGKGPLELPALEALALTKMDWNNDALYDPLPVTIQYSRKLARTIANVPSLPNSEYPYRMFM
jgi:hypothetical protein